MSDQRQLDASLSSPSPGRPLLRDEESRLAESFERSRHAFAELIGGLPGPLRERVLDGDPDGATLGSRWPLAGLEAGFDRLVRLARTVELPTETLGRAQRLKRRIKHTRESLIVANLGLVYLLAHKSRDRGIPFSDLVQEGTLGLIRAVERFDHRRDCRLSSYAHWWVRKSIHAAFDNFEDGAEYLGFLACSAPEPLERAIVDQSHAQLRRAIAALPPREARVVRLRFGIDAGDPRTLKQIAGLLGVSRERVRQIEVGALEKLRGVVRKYPDGEVS